MSRRGMHYPDPPLGDGQVGLRAWRDTDVDCVMAASPDPSIRRDTSVPAAVTPESAAAFIGRQKARLRDGEGVALAIVETPEDRAVGHLFLAVRPQPYVGGVGYWVVPAARGRGVAAAALRLAVPWSLEAFDLVRLEAWVRPDNVASQRTLLRAGFELEGRLRHLNTADEVSDALVYAVVRDRP